MHTNFYHWHARVELKPAPAILQSRWDAAAKFGKNAAAQDIRALLGLMFFSSAEPEFIVRFGGELVKAEPTFPLGNRDELMRVMAAAALSSLMEMPTTRADAVALGVRASSLGGVRVEPLWQDIFTQTNHYLAKESERLRPKSYSSDIEKSEKQITAHLATLKKAVETNELSKIGEATQVMVLGISTAVKDSHKQLGLVIERIAEESQFMWWLITSYSPTLKKRRADVEATAYIITCATEAGERVDCLPPSESVPALIGAVLGQCNGEAQKPMPLADLVKLLADAPQRDISASMLTPLSGLAAEMRAGNPFTATLVARFQFSENMTMSPTAAAQQWFHELMFTRALTELQ